jgi:parallel beta-helix repeat protein
MRRTVNIALVLILIMALGMICVQPVKAQYQGNITISASGSISPASAPIQRIGNTYTLTGDINGSVTIVKSNIVLDGNAHAVSVPLALASTGSIIALRDVSNVTVANLTVTGGQFGISVEGTGNLIEDNTVTESGTIYVWNGADSGGIYVNGGSSNNVTNNILEKNVDGLEFVDTSNNLIVGNDVQGGPNYYDMGVSGIYFGDASNNTIYHNNFENLGALPQAESFNSTNHWDNGYPSGGNYWGYQTGKQIDDTGISDVPYVIDAQNKDLYPLTEPFNPSFLANYEQEVIPPKVSVLSPLNKAYDTTNISLAFSINKPFNWVGYSLDGKQNVTVNGNSTITDIAYGSHSITIYANSTFGIIGISKTIDFSIVKLEPFTPIIVIVVAFAAVAISVSLLIYRRHRKTSNEKATLTV